MIVLQSLPEKPPTYNRRDIARADAPSVEVGLVLPLRRKPRLPFTPPPDFTPGGGAAIPVRLAA